MTQQEIDKIIEIKELADDVLGAEGTNDNEVINRIIAICEDFIIDFKIKERSKNER